MEQIQNQINQWIPNRFDWNQSDLEQIDWIWQILDWRRGSNKIQSWSIAVFMGNCALSLSSTRVDSLGCSVGRCVGVWVDVLAQSSPRLTSRLSTTSVLHWWTLHQLISLDSMRNCAPPWAGWPANCIYPGTASSSRLVRTGIEVLLLLYCCNSAFEIRKSFGGSTVWCHYMCGWLLPLFYWGNLYLWSFFDSFL